MLDIYGIKANDCREQADVCFCDAGSKEVRFCTGHFAQVGFGPCEGGENIEYSALIGLLGSMRPKGQ